MANTNKAQIIKLCNEINKKEGKGSVYTVDSEYANLKINRWSTGIEDLDAIIGGGMPEGRIIEIYGPESSGKTTLLYHLCGLHSLCLDIPIEGTFDAARAKIFGNRPKQMLIYRASYGEDAFNKTINFAKAGIPLIGIDSVPSLIPRDDAEKVLKSANKDTIEEQRIGGTARLINKYLPIVEDIIDITGTTIIFNNQVRDKMDAMMFGEKTNTPGGHKLKHAASIRIQVARRAWIDIPNKNPKNSAKNEHVGMIMKCKVVKSKVSNPGGECEIPLFFDRGFVSFDDVKSIRKELMVQRAEQYGRRVRDIDMDDDEEEDY
ncbi:MAG: DNA recombination/repair protein RecA [Lachnospiraceae bacterium]|nr:DNA recombination/repair protein RecA [Lachnospiraceae bacterium]